MERTTTENAARTARLEALREEQKARKANFGYDGRCRGLSREEAQERDVVGKADAPSGSRRPLETGHAGQSSTPPAAYRFRPRPPRPPPQIDNS